MRTMTTMNLTQYAQHLGVSDSTIRRRYRAGEIDLPHRREGNTVLVEVPEKKQVTAAYVADSDPEQCERRVDAVRKWADEHGMAIETIVADDSGTRNQLLDLLSDSSVTRIVTDRAGFDRELLAAALSAQGRELITTQPQPQQSNPNNPNPFQPRKAEHGTGA